MSVCFDLNNHYFSSYFTVTQLNVLSLHPLSQVIQLGMPFMCSHLKKIVFPSLKCGNYHQKLSDLGGNVLFSSFMYLLCVCVYVQTHKKEQKRIVY